MSTAPDLGDVVRARLRETFTVAVAEGRAKPLVIPYSFLGPFIVPSLWLAIPHTKRPWVYRTRWLVVAFVLVFNVHIIRTASSTNFAVSYAAGLMAAWGILSTLHLLVWTRPQFEAARAVKRAKAVEGQAMMTMTTMINGGSGYENGGPREDGTRQRRRTRRRVVPKGEVAAKLDESENVCQEQSQCVWQTFPEDAPFLQRLNWAFDLTTSFRCIGWTYSIDSVPRPKTPADIVSGEPVDISSMPEMTRAGYVRSLTERQFLVSRLRSIGVMYLILDFLAVTMMKDPFFILGPDPHLDLPPYLKGLSPRVLLVYREIYCLAGVYCAIAAVFNLSDIVQYYCARRLFPARDQLWQYTSAFGSFSQVLDRGLAGWWGAWWHQTFRLQFVAPAIYLTQHGYLANGSQAAKIAALCASFVQSGFLHASGSVSSIPETKVWRNPAFFTLQIPGVLLNQLLTSLGETHLPRLPRRLFHAFNLVFSLSWMYLTGSLFVDDLSSAGIWTLEPVPISPLRWLGAGHPEDHWWRWDREHFPKWYSGEHWWESGVAL